MNGFLNLLATIDFVVACRLGDSWTGWGYREVEATVVFTGVGPAVTSARIVR